MSAEPARLRSAIAAYLEDEARSRLDRHRGSRRGSDPADVVARHAFLGSRHAVDLLSELLERRRVTSENAGALADHLRRFSREVYYASIRRSLRDLQRREVEVRGNREPFRAVVAALAEGPKSHLRSGRLEALERSAAAACSAIVQRRREAGEGASLLPSLRGPDHKLISAVESEAVLSSTQDLLEEGLDWLSSRTSSGGLIGGGRLRDVFDLFLALRAPELDDVFPKDDRFLRLADFARNLGLADELRARVQVSSDHGSADPRARLVVVKAPFEVRIAPSWLELGAVSELAAADTTGRALASCLVHPELPIEFRHPIEGTVGRAFGVLFRQWAFGASLTRARRLPASVIEHSRRLAAFVTVLSLRASATSAALGPGASSEEVAESARRSIGLPWPPSVATVAFHGAGGAQARLRGQLGGLALWIALRDRFDDDWYRNPKVREVVRGAVERGSALSIEAFLEEQSGSMDRSSSRLAEWFRGR